MEIFINIIVGSLEISIGLVNKKLGTVRNRICQAFLFNLQLIITLPRRVSAMTAESRRQDDKALSLERIVFLSHHHSAMRAYQLEYVQES